MRIRIWMTVFFVALGLALGACGGAGGGSVQLGDSGGGAKVPFERIPASLLTSAISDKRFVTVKDSASWQALWNEHVANVKPAPPAPAVDFSSNMVLGVFIGPESVVCGSMQIESVTRYSGPGRLLVGYKVTDPGPAVTCVAAMINQYSMVTIPATSLPVEFVKLQ